METSDCRFFNGYKPCTRGSACDRQCPSYSRIEEAVLVIHLGAMGSVVRSTALLRKIKELYPRSFVVWLTEKPSHEILKFHPAIDRVLEFNFESMMTLKAFHFECVYALDKDIKTAGLLPYLNTKRMKGFKANMVNGGIVPIDADAQELWELGLSNEKKFFENAKSEIQLLFETCGWVYNREPYWLHLTDSEQVESLRRRKLWLGSRRLLVGINTGCGNVITYKKMSLGSQLRLIDKIHQHIPEAQIVLLGGRDEASINQQIYQKNPNVILSATQQGVRDGLQSIAAMDILISGDSFAMHAGIAFGVHTLAWFGPTCAHEVDFYDNGASIKSNFSCSPCWKRDCSKERMCYDYPDIDQFIKHILRWKEDRESAWQRPSL